MTIHQFGKPHSSFIEQFYGTLSHLVWQTMFFVPMTFAILGPMQPFLAYNLQTDTQTINLVWTLGFLGFLVGSLITSHIFTRYLRTSLRKLMFMSSVMLLTGLATLCLPFIMNLPLLLMARFIQVFKDCFRLSLV